MMKLYCSDSSPFARKCRMIVIELGLENDVEFVDPGVLTPLQVNDTVVSGNPLGKIPSLTMNDGSSLQDSRVICEFLDLKHDGGFFPKGGEDRIRALHLQALADGVMDTGVALRYETAFRKPEHQQEEIKTRNFERISATLDHFNGITGSFAETPTIGEITLACALGYLDFRFADLGWRDGRPELTAWLETFSQRKSFQATEPV